MTWPIRIAVLVCVVLAGCRGSSDRSETTPPVQRAERDAMTRLHMRENFGLLHAIELQLVYGHLGPARELAGSISDTPNEPSLDAWASQEAHVRDLAEAIRGATTVGEGLRAETRLAAACASCHRSAHAAPEVGQPPRRPPNGPTVEDRMSRHAWATGQLWAGMIADDDATWRAALQVLASEPLPEAVMADRAPFAAVLQERARTALRETTRDPDARANTYAHLLDGCVSCHAR